MLSDFLVQWFTRPRPRYGQKPLGWFAVSSAMAVQLCDNPAWDVILADARTLERIFASEYTGSPIDCVPVRYRN